MFFKHLKLHGFSSILQEKLNYIYKYFDLFAALFCVIIADKRKEGKVRFVKSGFLATWFCGTKIQEIQKIKRRRYNVWNDFLQSADRKEAEKAMALIGEAKEFLKS